MLVTNWFGVFTVLLVTHLVVIVLAYTAGKESN